MTGFQYQCLAMRTRNKALSDDDTLLNSVCGLNGEAGECIDLIKKSRFQGHELDEDKLAEELGDVCWYIALACEALHINLDDVLMNNINKLAKRYGSEFSVDASVNRTE